MSEQPRQNDDPVFDARHKDHIIFPEKFGARADEVREVNAGELHTPYSLYDEKVVDEATGTVIDNSTDKGLDGLAIRQELPPAEDEDTRNDAAARWLQENDPDLKRKN